MSLTGAKLICLDDNGARGEVILANGRTFTIGYFMNCDYVVSDMRAKGVHCEIQCDAYGRVTIRNMSEEHPIAINGHVVEIKRPLLNGTRITALDRNFLWEFPPTSSSEYEDLLSSQVSTPQKQVGIPEQPPNSCPNLLFHRGMTKRFTVHNFAYCIKSDDKQNQAQQEESAPSKQLPPTISIVAATNTGGKARSVTPDPVPSTGAVAEQLQLKVTPRNDMQRTQKLLSLCQESGTLITSYSPRQTGFCMGKSFAHFVSATTPRSSYSTPQSIMSDDGSRDFIDFATPGTSASNNCSMHLIDLTTPSKLRPATPLPKSASKVAYIKKNLLSTQTTAKAPVLRQQLKEQLGITPVTPHLSFDSNDNAMGIPSSAESVISVDSSDEASVIELSDVDGQTHTPTSAKIMKTLATICQAKLSTKVTPRRTPQSLIKRALITSATKHYVRAQPAAMGRTTARLRTPKSPAATSSSTAANALRLSMSAPTKQKISLVRQLRMDSPGASTSQRARQLTSTPVSTARRRTTAALANDSPLGKVRKSISTIARDTQRSSQALAAKQIVAKAHRHALKSPLTLASITKITPHYSHLPHVSVKKGVLFTDAHNVENKNDAVPTGDEGQISGDLNSTFTVDGSVNTPSLFTKSTEEEQSIFNRTFSPIKPEAERVSETIGTLFNLPKEKQTTANDALDDAKAFDGLEGTHVESGFSPRTSRLLHNIEDTLNKSDEIERLKNESQATAASRAERSQTPESATEPMRKVQSAETLVLAAEKKRTTVLVDEVNKKTSHSVEAPINDASNNTELKEFKEVVDEDNVGTLLDTTCNDIQEENEAKYTDAAGSKVKTPIKVPHTTINNGESSVPHSTTLPVADEHESPHGKTVEFRLGEQKSQLSEDEEKRNKIKESKNIEASIKTANLVMYDVEMPKEHIESQPRLVKIPQAQLAFDKCFSGDTSCDASGDVLQLTTPTKIDSSVAKTAKRFNRPASLPSGAVMDAKDANAITGVTPKQMTRASLSIADNATIIEAICTPKRITKRRPSICLMETPSKLKTPCSKRLTLGTIDSGNIILEETLTVAEINVEIEDNVIEPTTNDTNDSGPPADHGQPIRNVISDNDVLEESFCEVIADSECIHKNVHSPQFEKQYEITTKMANDNGSFGEVVGKVLPVHCVEIKHIDGSDSYGKNDEMANPDESNIYESDYDYGKEVNDSAADAEEAANQIYDNVALQLKETEISKGLQVKVVGKIVVEPTFTAEITDLVGAAEQVVLVNKEETKDDGEAFESLSAVNVIESSSPDPTTPVKGQGSKGEVLSPFTPSMQGIRELLRTPKVCAETPKLVDLRHLLRTPKCQDAENVVLKAHNEGLEGISALMRTPKMEFKRELSEKDDLKESPSTSANADGKNYRGVRELLQTPKIYSTPPLKAVREMMMTPKNTSTPHLDGVYKLTDNDSPLATCKEDAMDGTDLVKYLRTPSSKNLMMSQEPASVVFQQKSKEFINSAVLASIECDLDQISTGLNLEDMFKMPTSGDFSARIAATQSEISQESAVVSEINNRVSSSSASYNVTTDVSFDNLAGQPTVSHLTPAKNVYTRKSLTHTAQQSPFSQADVLSDLPKTEIQKWVDSLEGMNAAMPTELGSMSLVEEQELTVTGSMIGCDNGDLSCDPLSATASMLKQNDSSIYQPTDTSIKVFLAEVVDNADNMSTASGIIDPLSCSMPKKAFEQEDTTQRPATPNEGDISGINFLDETTESEFLEPLVVSDSESLDKTIGVRDSSDDQEPVKDSTVEAFPESLVVTDTDSESNTTEETPAKLTGEKSETEAAKLRLEKSIDLDLMTEFKHFLEQPPLKEKTSATPNPMKVRSELARKTLSGLDDLKTDVDRKASNISKIVNKSPSEECSDEGIQAVFQEMQTNLVEKSNSPDIQAEFVHFEEHKILTQRSKTPNPIKKGSKVNVARKTMGPFGRDISKKTTDEETSNIYLQDIPESDTVTVENAVSKDKDPHSTLKQQKSATPNPMNIRSQQLRKTLGDHEDLKVNIDFENVKPILICNPDDYTSNENAGIIMTSSVVDSSVVEQECSQQTFSIVESNTNIDIKTKTSTNEDNPRTIENTSTDEANFSNVSEVVKSLNNPSVTSAIGVHLETFFTEEENEETAKIAAKTVVKAMKMSSITVDKKNVLDATVRTSKQNDKNAAQLENSGSRTTVNEEESIALEQIVSPENIVVVPIDHTDAPSSSVSANANITLFVECVSEKNDDQDLVKYIHKQNIHKHTSLDIKSEKVDLDLQISSVTDIFADKSNKIGEKFKKMDLHFTNSNAKNTLISKLCTEVEKFDHEDPLTASGKNTSIVEKSTKMKKLDQDFINSCSNSDIIEEEKIDELREKSDQDPIFLNLKANTKSDKLAETEKTCDEYIKTSSASIQQIAKITSEIKDKSNKDLTTLNAKLTEIAEKSTDFKEIADQGPITSRGKETSVPEKLSKIDFDMGITCTVVEAKVDKDRLIPKTSLLPDSSKTKKLEDGEEVPGTPAVKVPPKRRGQKKLDEVVPEHLNTSKSILIQENTGCHSKRRYGRPKKIADHNAELETDVLKISEKQTVARNEITDMPVNEVKTNSGDDSIETVENDTAQVSKRRSVENTVAEIVESSLSEQKSIEQPVKEEKAIEPKRKGGRRQKNIDEKPVFHGVEKEMEELVEPALPKKVETSKEPSPVEETSTSNKNYKTTLGEQKTSSDDGPVEEKKNDSAEVIKLRSEEKPVEKIIESSLSEQGIFEQPMKEEKTFETKRKGDRRQKNIDEKPVFHAVEKEMEELVEPALPKKVETFEEPRPVEETSTSNKNYKTTLGEQKTNSDDGPLEKKNNDSAEVIKLRSEEKPVEKIIESSLSEQGKFEQPMKEEKAFEPKRKGGRRQKNIDEKPVFHAVEKEMEELVEPALPKKVEIFEEPRPVEETSTSNKNYKTTLGEQKTNSDDGPLEEKKNDSAEVIKLRSEEKPVEKIIESSLSEQGKFEQPMKEEKAFEPKRKGGRRQKNIDEKPVFHGVEKEMVDVVEPVLPKKVETSEETAIKPVTEKLIWSETLVRPVPDEGPLIEVNETKLDDMPKRGRGNETVARRAVAGGSRRDNHNVAGQKTTETGDNHQTTEGLADEQQPKKCGRKRKESYTDKEQAITKCIESPQKPEIIEASSITPKTGAPRRTRKASTIDVDKSASQKAADTPQSQRGRNVQRRAAATVEHNYDETSDSEQPFESKQIVTKSAAAKPLVLSSGRIHKPSAKVQQLLEIESGKAESPRRRVVASAVKLPARSDPKPSTTVEIDEMSATPTIAKRGRGRPHKVTVESSHSEIDPASSEVDDAHGGYNESAPRKRPGRPAGIKKQQTENALELENTHSSHNIEKERPKVKAVARGRFALHDKDKKHQTGTACELEDTHSSHTEENEGVVANVAARGRVGRKRKVEPVLTEPTFPHMVETSNTHADEENEVPKKVMPRGRVGRKPKVEQSGRSEGSAELLDPPSGHTDDKKDVTQQAPRGRGRTARKPKTEQNEAEATSEVNDIQSSDAAKKEAPSKMAPRARGKRAAIAVEQHSTEDENNKNPPQQNSKAANTASAIEGEQHSSKTALAQQKTRKPRAAAKTVTSALKDYGTDDEDGASQEFDTQMPKTTSTRARRGRKAKNEEDDEKAHAANGDTKDKTPVTKTTVASIKRTVAARRPSSDDPPAVKRSRRRAVEQIEVVAEVTEQDEVTEEEVKPGTSRAAAPGRGRKMVRFEAGIEAGATNPATPVTEGRSTRSRRK